MFAALLNWNTKDNGAQDSRVYFVVLTLLDFFFYSFGFSSGPKWTCILLMLTA